MDLNTVEGLVPGDRAALDGWEPGDAWLAGGTWLFSEPQPEVRRLIDLSAFEWPALTASKRGLEISATCTLAELARWPGTDSTSAVQWPATSVFRQCCRALLGSFKVWNVATVGGNMCLALPAGPMTSLTASLDGSCTVWEPGGGVRTIGASEFILGPGHSALGPGELLRSILLPQSALRCATAFRQCSLAPIGRSAVVVIGRRAPDDGEVVVTLTASVSRPAQLRFASLPTATELSQALEDAKLAYFDDPHGHPEWREDLTRLYVEEVRSELEEAS